MQRVVSVCRRFSFQIVNTLTSSTAPANATAYPHVNTACLQRLKHTDASPTTENIQAAEPPASSFSGYIPVEELEFSYSRSSGPGGQNVNKVNTKVEARFHLPSASWISEDVKSKLIEEQQNRITKDGYLVITSDRTRKQLLNQADVMDKLRSMLFKAAMKPRGLTQEEIQLRDKRATKSKEQTLRVKRQQSLTRQSRGSL